ncbi:MULTISPECIES: acetaldehyde dehydrogenase (acetylating) [Streptococcus]|uniref:Acetaldehyde dehydrogenase (Acetylating) n=1 Tax=Streptococcus iners subsp. hyiners TaxID=3028083 RepID=A0AA96VRK9_9STRE|nr:MULTISPECIES: acetaldehyde dehydrogenase (acetylating) [Streptococcus]MCK4029015.1 acetaldehyde dehydrogenase (acetylating) [Streptococcus suis]NQI70339.1 acetaldehyde dehydrogenase (acetylating) [Streptococcus suis]WNY49949.1 acetaldehyde dehydrogenase (acetylating) [Streptococcus sp. 29892]HEM3194403.1 acetaldehyde dehydrogenase (acetylating) [Streptococcus suis 10581]
MYLEDKDLVSIQEVRNLVRQAKNAQRELAQMSQEQIDTIVKVVAKACYDERERLAKMAVEETGFGRWQDKVIKNTVASKVLLEHIKNMKTVGILREDTEKKIIEVGVPVGVIAGLIPSTNPTSTVMYKALISLKAGNSIVFSPHPSALKCIVETVEIIKRAAKTAGCPDGAISVIEKTSIAATNELMRHKDTNLILATGGTAMVKAAYSSGTPAIGVGPGNGPAFIERSADIPTAVRHIIESKTFDNGVICASEQSVIVEEDMKDIVIAEFKKQGAYFLPPADAKKLGEFIILPSGAMNPKMVGKTPQIIAERAGISVPADARVLIAEECRVGKDAPYSMEKLAPILGFYTVKTWEEACDLSIKILHHEGVGHTLSIHSKNDEIIREFALKKPVSRLLVNTPAALGGVGGTTGLFPAFTLGCGAVGGSATSDNVSPHNLYNIRRVAYGTSEYTDFLKAENLMDSYRGTTTDTNISSGPTSSTNEDELVELLVKQVLAKLGQ